MIWMPHATVATIVRQNNQFLMVEELISGQPVFNQPAGHIEAGELIAEAALRETLEETGWQVELTDFMGVYTYLAPSNGEIYYRMCFGANPIEQISTELDEGIVAAHWLTYDEILARKSALRSPLVKQCIDDYLAGQRFPLSMIKEFIK
ncbi:MAG: NUDIX hydrolase [Hahellaceae bacterium]|nr:NUDIX hydrolase [Hahellaceae bacterium]